MSGATPPPLPGGPRRSLSSRAVATLVTAAAALVLALLTVVIFAMVRSPRGFAVLALLSDREPPAALSPAATFERDTIRFEHPSNWSVDDSASSGTFTMLTIEPAVDSGMTVLLADQPLEVTKLLDESFSVYRKMYRVREEATFATWGPFTGSGRTYRGSFLGERHTLRTFICTNAPRQLGIIEIARYKDERQLRPGFAAIEKSVTIKATRPADAEDPTAP